MKPREPSSFDFDFFSKLETWGCPYHGFISGPPYTIRLADGSTYAEHQPLPGHWTYLWDLGRPDIAIDDKHSAQGTRFAGKAILRSSPDDKDLTYGIGQLLNMNGHTWPVKLADRVVLVGFNQTTGGEGMLFTLTLTPTVYGERIERKTLQITKSFDELGHTSQDYPSNWYRLDFAKDGSKALFAAGTLNEQVQPVWSGLWQVVVTGSFDEPAFDVQTLRTAQACKGTLSRSRQESLEKVTFYLQETFKDEPFEDFPKCTGGDRVKDQYIYKQGPRTPPGEKVDATIGSYEVSARYADVFVHAHYDDAGELVTYTCDSEEKRAESCDGATIDSGGEYLERTTYEARNNYCYPVTREILIDTRWTSLEFRYLDESTHTLILKRNGEIIDTAKAIARFDKLFKQRYDSSQGKYVITSSARETTSDIINGETYVNYESLSQSFTAGDFSPPDEQGWTDPLPLRLTPLSQDHFMGFPALCANRVVCLVALRRPDVITDIYTGRIGKAQLPNGSVAPDVTLPETPISSVYPLVRGSYNPVTGAFERNRKDQISWV